MKIARRREKLRLRRGTYLLPSLFTIGNILLGFYALVSGLRGQFEQAAILIFIAVVLDGLDGRIARLTHTESDFGREFDSLADVLTFGAVPAYLTYMWGLQDLGRIGWLIPMFYLVCTAARLARFNVQVQATDSRSFVGLPAPAAAAAVASMLLLSPNSAWKSWTQGLALAVVAGLAALMVSTFRYWSPKQIDLKKRWSYRVALPLALVLVVVAYHPPAFFVSVAVLYTLSAPFTWCIRWGRKSFRRSTTDTVSKEEQA